MGFLSFFIKRKKTSQKTGRAISVDRDFVKSKIGDIDQLISLGGPSRFRTAIIDADNLLDHVLKSKGYKGNTMGERLKSARKDLEWADYDLAWKAHKVRNQVVHEADSEILSWQAQEAVRNFKKVIGALIGY